MYNTEPALPNGRSWLILFYIGAILIAHSVENRLEHGNQCGSFGFAAFLNQKAQTLLTEQVIYIENRSAHRLMGFRAAAAGGRRRRPEISAAAPLARVSLRGKRERQIGTPARPNEVGSVGKRKKEGAVTKLLPMAEAKWSEFLLTQRQGGGG